MCRTAEKPGIVQLWLLAVEDVGWTLDCSCVGAGFDQSTYSSVADKDP